MVADGTGPSGVQTNSWEPYNVATRPPCTLLCGMRRGWPSPNKNDAPGNPTLHGSGEGSGIRQSWGDCWPGAPLEPVSLAPSHTTFRSTTPGVNSVNMLSPATQRARPCAVGAPARPPAAG